MTPLEVDFTTFALVFDASPVETPLDDSSDSERYKNRLVYGKIGIWEGEEWEMEKTRQSKQKHTLERPTRFYPLKDKS